MYVCICNVVTDSEIRDAVRDHKIHCRKDFTKLFGISNQCGICAKSVRAVIDEELQLRFQKQTTLYK